MARVSNSGKLRTRAVLGPKLWPVVRLYTITLLLELMVKLRTLLTVIILILKAEAHDYGTGVLILTRLGVLDQLQCTVPVGQSEQTVLVGRRDFAENEAFERGRA